MVSLPAIFSSGAVFQQNAVINLNGTATPNHAVSIRLVLCSDKSISTSYQTVTDEYGQFSVLIHTPKASFDLYRLELLDTEEFVIDKILFGEVWMAAGQSNMEYPNYAADGHDVFYKLVEKDTIRYFRQDRYENQNTENDLLTHVPFNPTNTLGGVWSDVRDIENFQMISAVASSFAKNIYDFLNSEGKQIPVAIINNSIGGVNIESYLAKEDVMENPDLYEYLKKIDGLPEKAKWNQRNTMNFTQTTGLYNSKMYALRGIKCRGVLWYQGESNIGDSGTRTEQKYYQKALTVLRSRFEKMFRDESQHNFPLIASQLAPYAYGMRTICNLNYLNEAISNAVKSDPENFAVIPNYDQPIKWDILTNHPIHPCVKYPIGERMALCAKSLSYGAKSVKTAPMDKKVEVCGCKIRITFSDTGSGLCTKGDKKALGFWICGQNRIYVPAEAVITAADTIELSNEFIDAPQFAVYNYPSLERDGNVYSREGLPLIPFATDKEGPVQISAKPWLNLDQQRMWVHHNLTDVHYDVFYHPVWHGISGSNYCTDDIFTETGTALHISGDVDHIGVSLHQYTGYDFDLTSYKALHVDMFNLQNECYLELEIAINDMEKTIKRIPGRKIQDHDLGWVEFSFDFNEIPQHPIEKMSFIFNIKNQKYRFVNMDNLRLVP